MRRRAFILASTGAAATITGCSGGDNESEDDGSGDLPMEATVSINDRQFDPRVVHIAVEGDVTWENNSDESHRLHAVRFHSESTGWRLRRSVEPGESVSYTFESNGLFDVTDPNLGESEMCGRVRVGSADEGQSLPCE